MVGNQILILLLLSSLTLIACKKKGCTDSAATNYSTEAEKDDGSCIYPIITTVPLYQKIAYGANERQFMELYLPANHDANTKTVICIHGGAWVLGFHENVKNKTFTGGLGWNLKDKLINEGYAVAVLTYRLACYVSNEADLTGSPHTYMDMMLEDVQLAIDKLKADATINEIGNSDFAIVGESAGAHIALMYGLRNTADPAVKTVVAFYAPTLLDNVDFKNNMSSAPYNAVPVSGDFHCYKNSGASCGLEQGFSANFMWTVRSLVGFNLPVSSRTSAFTDTISPAYPNNVQNNIPFFLLHGEDDDLVPSDQSDSLLVVLNSKFGTSPAADTDFDSPHKMLKYPSCGHGWNGSCNKTTIMNDVATWLSIHL